jgi:NAD(P)H-quinone oxidoreductase subunit 5
VDELYDLLVVNRTKDLGTQLGAFDKTFVDGAVNGTATFTKVTSTISKLFDKYVVDGLVNLVGIASQGLGSLNRTLQNGVMQRYAMGIIIGVVLLIGFYFYMGQ